MPPYPLEAIRALANSRLFTEIERDEEAGTLTFALTQADYQTAPFFELMTEDDGLYIIARRDQRTLRSQRYVPALLDPLTAYRFCHLSGTFLAILAVRT
jgi:hypothetical protein